jgi:hypothetical protein
VGCTEGITSQWTARQATVGQSKVSRVTYCRGATKYACNLAVIEYDVSLVNGKIENEQLLLITYSRDLRSQQTSRRS